MLDDKRLIHAEPTKEFFMEMLTRDISLEDAILDLLDNCIDGIQRVIAPEKYEQQTPYEGFFANINFDGEKFEIEDNCGGIPLDIAKEYAFKFGRPKDAPPGNFNSIGTYGIGMKRAMFKIGSFREVISYTKDVAFRVAIDANWIEVPDWNLQYETLEGTNDHVGTRIHVSSLNPSIKRQFEGEKFKANLADIISEKYSFLMQKGFQISVNGTVLKPKEIKFVFDIQDGNERGIAPYIFQGSFLGIEIELVVGFYRSIPSEEEVEKSLEGKSRSSDDAGWTIIANDRVIVYNDKTHLTGWGMFGVPKYHTQFIAISGVVFLRGNPRDLPITTTKHSLNVTSDVYPFILKHMQEGLKIFTDFTNKFKKKSDLEQQFSDDKREVSALSIDIEVEKSHLKWANTDSGRIFKPKLPIQTNHRTSTTRTIRFTKSPEEIRIVQDYLFESEQNPTPSDVGNEAFVYVLRKAKERAR